jgi:hypothetical protein
MISSQFEAFLIKTFNSEKNSAPGYRRACKFGLIVMDKGGILSSQKTRQDSGNVMISPLFKDLSGEPHG